MKESQASRIHELAERVGGYFRLTSLVQKRLREAVRGSSAFAPSQNTNTLFELTLDEVEQGSIEIALPEEAEAAQE